MVWLGAGGVLLGLIGTLPTAASAFSQTLAARVGAGVRGARAFISTSWILQGAALAALGAFALLPAPSAVPLVCATAGVAWFLAGVSAPAWTSLVARTVPRDRHGRFFGLRGAAQQTGVVIAILGGGLLLSATSSAGRIPLGYVLVFGLAGLSRAIGAGFLLAVPEPRREPRRLAARKKFVIPATSAKFRRLAAYLWALHFATWVAAPFFLPYMLRELQLDYGTVALLVAIPAVVKALSMSWWGRLADRVGAGTLLRSMGWFVLPVSAMWLLSGNPWWIVVAQLYAGLAWGAFELAQSSALLQTTRGREETIAWFNAVDGGVMILGSLVGGMIVTGAGRLIGSGFLAAIAASTLLRALAAILLLRGVRWVGLPGFSHHGMPLRMWGVRATRGATFRPWAELATPADSDLAPRRTPGRPTGNRSSPGSSVKLPARKQD
jgi:MFS family permease